MVVVITGAIGTPAWAYWSTTGSANATATTATLAAPTDVTFDFSAAPDVTVTWTAGVGGVAPSGYFVTRDNGTTVSSACGSSPSELIELSTCTDSALPPGTYTYIVTAAYRSWTASSAPGGPTTVEDAAKVAFVNEPSDAMAIDANPATSPALTEDTSAPVTELQPPILAAAQGFSLLSGTTVVNTGVSTVSGDVGVSPGAAITGFAEGSVRGDLHNNDAAAAAAQTAQGVAYASLKDRTASSVITSDLAGQTLLPGVYHSTAALELTGALTLDGNDDPNAVFIFQSDATFNTTANSQVVLINGAQASNVYWVIADAAGTGADTKLVGSILARGEITLGDGTTLIGRALSMAAVTVAGSTILRLDITDTGLAGPAADTAEGTKSLPIAEDSAPAPSDPETAADTSTETAPSTTQPTTPTSTSDAAPSTLSESVPPSSPEIALPTSTEVATQTSLVTTSQTAPEMPLAPNPVSTSFQQTLSVVVSTEPQPGTEISAPTEVRTR